MAGSPRLSFWSESTLRDVGMYVGQAQSLQPEKSPRPSLLEGEGSTVPARGREESWSDVAVGRDSSPAHYVLLGNR